MCPVGVLPTTSPLASDIRAARSRRFALTDRIAEASKLTFVPKRDDFSAATKRTLAQRVAHRCSRSECGAVTAGPTAQSAGVVSVGVAAHITAASAGGPRFDPTETAAQRRGIENGIWLCQTCATLIDRDPERFTVSVLRVMKALAEDRALKLIGKRDERDVEPEANIAICAERDDQLPDYITFDVGILRRHIADLQQRIRLLESEAERLEVSPLALLGPSAEARGEAEHIRERMRSLVIEAEAIEAGYPRWDKWCFETTCDCCAINLLWYGLLEVLPDGSVVSNQDASVRVAAEALESIEVAVRTGLFTSIVVALTFDYPDDPEAIFAPGPFDYHGFGEMKGQDHKDSLFHITSWRVDELASPRIQIATKS